MKTYRRDLDGLRAISVLAVILYHAKFEIFGRPLLPGGFLGVDVFFVISGYLISKILLQELKTTGKISIGTFYDRRVRRILPVLTVVGLSTILFAWTSLLPEDFVDLAASIIAALLFVSNFFFYFETTEYGADDALLEPFLHTWSLAVEEQFYLIFPLVLLILFRHQRPKLIVWLRVICGASFMFAVIYAKENPDLNFFLPFSRAWELLLGTLVAYREVLGSQGCPRSDRWLLAIPRWFFIGAIVVPLFLVPSIEGHPGLVTLPVVLGTAAILFAGPTTGAAGLTMTSRPAVAIGLLSYSLYLWHFPIFAFGRAANSAPETFDKLIWIALTVVLSIASYFVVERPFRNHRIIGPKLGLGSLVVLPGLLIGMCATVLSSNGFPERVPQQLRTFNEPPGYRSLAIDGKRCHNKVEDFCLFEIDDEARTTVILTGDSHADSLANDLYAKLKPLDLRGFGHLTSSGCPIILGFSVEGRQYCQPDVVLARLKFIEDIAQARPTIIVYFARTPVYLTGERFDGGLGRREEGAAFNHLIDGDRQANLENTLQQLSDVGELIVVYPMPEVGQHAQRYFLERIHLGVPGEMQRVMTQEPLHIDRHVFEARAASSYAVLDGLSIPDANRIYPEDFLCDAQASGICTTHRSGQLLYTDSNHPNWILADEMNRKITARIADLLPKL
ncbi:acyltransferase family protein [uncultured Tateyamaria sp.]|uniref:acyltransferase family protein n=1 Tax=uncultured Tateyamaria sp. TaxID=455651 RepID=UPI0026297E0A|nr:acyltransferase family protein [uncultured Tateyamaria sp.]